MWAQQEGIEALWEVMMGGFSGQQQRTGPLQLVVGAGKHDNLTWPTPASALRTTGQTCQHRKVTC